MPGSPPAPATSRLADQPGGPDQGSRHVDDRRAAPDEKREERGGPGPHEGDEQHPGIEQGHEHVAERRAHGFAPVRRGLGFRPEHEGRAGGDLPGRKPQVAEPAEQRAGPGARAHPGEGRVRGADPGVPAAARHREAQPSGRTGSEAGREVRRAGRRPAPRRWLPRRTRATRWSQRRRRRSRPWAGPGRGPPRAGRRAGRTRGPWSQRPRSSRPGRGRRPRTPRRLGACRRARREAGDRDRGWRRGRSTAGRATSSQIVGVDGQAAPPRAPMRADGARGPDRGMSPPRRRAAGAGRDG